MLIAHKGMVQLSGRIPEDLLIDTECVIGTFIKTAHEHGMSDEFIEKTLVGMIAQQFQVMDKNVMFDVSKEIKKDKMDE